MILDLVATVIELKPMETAPMYRPPDSSCTSC